VWVGFCVLLLPGCFVFIDCESLRDAVIDVRSRPNSRVPFLARPGKGTEKKAAPAGAVLL